MSSTLFATLASTSRGGSAETQAEHAAIGDAEDAAGGAADETATGVCADEAAGATSDFEAGFAQPVKHRQMATTQVAERRSGIMGSPRGYPNGEETGDSASSSAARAPPAGEVRFAVRSTFRWMLAVATLSSLASATPPSRLGATLGVPSPTRPTTVSVSRATIDVKMVDEGFAVDTATYELVNPGAEAATLVLQIPASTQRDLADAKASLDGAAVPILLTSPPAMQLELTVPPKRAATLRIEHGHDGGNSRGIRVAPEGQFSFQIDPDHWASFAPVDFVVHAPAGHDLVTTPVTQPGTERRLRLGGGRVDLVLTDRRALWFGWNDHRPYFAIVVAAMVLAAGALSVALGREARRLDGAWKRGLFVLFASLVVPVGVALAGYTVAMPMPHQALGMEYGVLALLLVFLSWPVAGLVSFAVAQRRSAASGDDVTA